MTGLVVQVQVQVLAQRAKQTPGPIVVTTKEQPGASGNSKGCNKKSVNPNPEQPQDTTVPSDTGHQGASEFSIAVKSTEWLFPTEGAS